MICTSDGRSLDYLRARAPHPPPKWLLLLNLVWPSSYVEAWRARQMLEREQDLRS